MVIRLKKNKEKAVLNFHPWVFSGAIESVAEGTSAGDIVEVQAHDGSSLAWGFYDPLSELEEKGKKGNFYYVWTDHCTHCCTH
ncbi:hypothetical protein [Leptospira jelokensis]|uniref:hypothetical protein n=1 Tax=Leptospira jelokensis TaxID=2484931 RepID=UPI001FC9194E|nr:hypothetical protein [Leptospira jelokensis]